MKTTQILGLLSCLLLLSGAVSARTVTVRDVIDYTDSGPGHPNYFWDQVDLLDHPPFYRHAWEDWGWTHDLTGLLPSDVTGIQGASLTIEAWDVNAENTNPYSPWGPEIDVVIVNDTVVGTLKEMAPGVIGQWTTTTFQLPPALLQELYRDRKLDVFVNIDQNVEDGHRVTLNNSTLVAYFTAAGDVPEPNVALHRFWSPVLSSHFYTISNEERDYLIATYPHVWTYEGIAYRAFGAALDGNLRPVYRFWSNSLGSHFYTISEEEKTWLLVNWGHVWMWENVAFYAYPVGSQPPGTKPVYRFWSPVLSKHFYTISESEKQWLIDNYSHVWTLEGIAWYAYEVQ